MSDEPDTVEADEQPAVAPAPNDAAPADVDPADVIVTDPPATDDDGRGTTDDYPTNELLRAQALHDAGEKTDPSGIVADDEIATLGAVDTDPVDASTIDFQPVAMVDGVPDWQPAPVDPETGHTMVDGYPLAGPARAIALAADGKTTDPAGIVSDATIAAFAPAEDQPA